MATIYWRNGCAYLNWSESGRQSRISLGKISERDAETAKQTKELELRTGRKVFVPCITFDELLVEYLEWRQIKFPDSHRRISQICRDCFWDFRGKPLSDIQRVDIDRWLASREIRVGHNRRKQRGRPAAETVRIELATLKAILNKGVEWGRGISLSPARYVKPPKDKNSQPIHWYTRDELALLYAADSEYGPAWKLMANTGMRRMEALHLEWRHVDISRGVIQIVSTLDERTKSSKWREVPVNSSAAQALEQLQSIRSGSKVLPRRKGATVTSAFARDAKRAGLAGSLHSLRHSYAAHLVMANVSLKSIQALMGHARFETTLRYAHLAKDHAVEQARAVEM